MSDPVVQWQIVSTNAEETASLCQKVFGWTITANNKLGYREVETGGVKGGIWPAPPNAQTFVQLFVAVADITQTLEKAVALGAMVVLPPTPLPDGDTMAIFAAPNGPTFGIVQTQ